MIGQSTSTISGDKTEPNRGAQNLWVVKIDANGNKLWDKTIGGSGSEEIYGSCFAQNGDLMLLGSSNSPVSGDKSQPSRGGNDFWLVRMTDLSQSNETGLRVIEPTNYANKGKVTMNLYGLPFDQNSAAKLVRNGFPDIIAENVTYLDSFLIQAVFNVDQKEVGQYSVQATLRNNQVSTLENAFTLEDARIGQICTQIVGSDRIRTTWTSNYVISLTQDGNTDLHNVPLWVSMSDIGEVNPQFQIFDEGRSVWQDNYWNEPAFIQNGKKYYALLVPKVAHGVSTFINFQIKAPTNAGQKIELEAWTTLPWEGNPYHNKGVPCLQSGLASILTDAIPQTLNNGDLFHALNVSTDSLSLNLERQGLVNSPKTYPIVLPQSQVYYASAIEALQRMNMSPSQSQQNALQQTIRQYLARVAEAEISPRSVQCTPQNWLNLQLCANQGGVTPPVITNMNEQTIIIDGSNLDQNPPVWNPHTQNQQNVHCITHSEVYTPHCKGTFVIIIVGAYDPNQKSGIAQRYINQAGKLNYLIEYENQPQATAPAHDVFIYDTLDAQVFDLTTFRFGAVGFGTYFSAPIVDYPQMQTDIDMRPAKPYIVRVKGEINDNIVRWHFATLDAQTLQPITDPTGGFLPPNQLSPKGQGFVHFSVASKADAPSGTTYRNKASIVFDSNAPIITNTHENVLDKIAPQSRVTALPVQINKSSFTLNWSGTDSGSGIEDYTIYVSENNGDYQVWLKNVNYTSAQFSGKIGNRYRFYSIARDKAGNWETTPNSPDAQTQIVQPVADEFNRLKPYLFDCVPNPFASGEGTKVWFYVSTEAHVQISVVNLNGDPVLEVYNAKTRAGRQSADLQGLPTGIYTVKMITGSYVGFRRIVVNL